MKFSASGNINDLRLLFRKTVILLSGDTGASKTTALRYYTQSNTGVIFIIASTCTSSPSAILKEISTAIEKKVSGSKSQIEKILISVLSNSNRLIIIDKADQLNFNAIQAVRNLNDNTRWYTSFRQQPHI